MNKQIFNPYLPSWEYIPDGEPHVFNDRVYIYGSHDKFNGDVYCMLDYVCYSAPVNDLSDWKYEGVIYRKDQDPANEDLQGNLYAPDVTVGPDGKYYLYYVLSKLGVVSVAVCDEPAGQYEFYGYVHYSDGILLGNRDTDEPQFDPGVLTEGDKTYMYTGFCAKGDTSRHGMMVTVIGPDMLTIIEEPQFVVPNESLSGGTAYEGHAFFEAPSIRKKDGKYVVIYSSELFHELCYAVSNEPTKGFEYKGVLVSNGDLNIDTYKPADKPMCYCANNHGSIVYILDSWYVFYHRHTNGTNYSRQGCFEKLTERADGTFEQAEITSCGGVKPLLGEGEYPTYIACNLFSPLDITYVPWSGWMDDRFQKITQEGSDGDEKLGYIANMRPDTSAGFKYFDCKGIKEIEISYKGYATGYMNVKTEWDGEPVAQIPLEYSNVWRSAKVPAHMEDGIKALYFTFKGEGHLQFKSFTFYK